jgi:very-short-patch-repair endonuclease
MDFLMLLPEGVRVVLEVDGKQHYSEADGTKPSPKTYAETVRGDRWLRLAGYEVYRFGGYELMDPVRCEPTLTDFFERLFRRHRVGIEGAD